MIKSESIINKQLDAAKIEDKILSDYNYYPIISNVKKVIPHKNKVISSTDSLSLMREYNRFMVLKIIENDTDGILLYPPPIIHIIWKKHILDTKKYREFCQLIGLNLDHPPNIDCSSSNNNFIKERYQRTLSLYSKYFLSDNPITSSSTPPTAQLIWFDEKYSEENKHQSIVYSNNNNNNNNQYSNKVNDNIQGDNDNRQSATQLTSLSPPLENLQKSSELQNQFINYSPTSKEKDKEDKNNEINHSNNIGSESTNQTQEENEDLPPPPDNNTISKQQQKQYKKSEPPPFSFIVFSKKRKDRDVPIDYPQIDDDGDDHCDDDDDGDGDDIKTNETPQTQLAPSTQPSPTTNLQPTPIKKKVGRPKKLANTTHNNNLNTTSSTLTTNTTSDINNTESVEDTSKIQIPNIFQLSNGLYPLPLELKLPPKPAKSISKSISKSSASASKSKTSSPNIINNNNNNRLTPTTTTTPSNNNNKDQPMIIKLEVEGNGEIFFYRVKPSTILSNVLKIRKPQEDTTSVLEYYDHTGKRLLPECTFSFYNIKPGDKIIERKIVNKEK
eukprot:gene5202-6478_t